MSVFSAVLDGLFAKIVGALVVVGLLACLVNVLRRRLRDKSHGEPLLTEEALVHDKSDYRVFYSNIYVIHFYIPARDTVVDCEVPFDRWQSMEPKTFGTLTHQGGKFYSFETTDATYCAEAVCTTNP